MEIPLTPENELRLRIDRFQKAIKKKGLDGAIISQNVDLFYFSGTTQRSVLYVPKEGSPILLVQKSCKRAKEESALEWVESIETGQDIKRVLKRHGIDSPQAVGLEFDVLPVDHFMRFQRIFPDVSFSDVSFAIRQLRMIKTSFEIEQIQKAVEVVEKMLSEARKVIQEGVSELEVDGLLGCLARSLGDQGRLRMRGWNQEMFHGHILSGRQAAITSFCTSPVCGEGPNPAIAQGAGAHKVRRGESIYIDYGVGINGYASDQTRTFCIGNPPKVFLKGFEALWEIKRDMERNAGPGVSGRGIYRRAVELARARGLEDYFMGHGEGKVPFVGHGVGLEMDELPLLGVGVNTRLEEGMVFAFEPKLVFPERGVVGVEDLYLVCSHGVERLTVTEDQLIILPG